MKIKIIRFCSHKNDILRIAIVQFQLEIQFGKYQITCAIQFPLIVNA